jgi:hypothetical protein
MILSCSDNINAIELLVESTCICPITVRIDMQEVRLKSGNAWATVLPEASSLGNMTAVQRLMNIMNESRQPFRKHILIFSLHPFNTSGLSDARILTHGANSWTALHIASSIGDVSLVNPDAGK